VKVHSVDSFEADWSAPSASPVWSEWTIHFLGNNVLKDHRCPISRVLCEKWGLAFGRYVIFYLPRKRGIEVVRVLHGARDLKPLFDEDV
jgi:hypothetical protein